MTGFFKFHMFQTKYMLGVQDLCYRIRTSPHLVAKLLALLIPVILLLAFVAVPYLVILYIC